MHRRVTSNICKKWISLAEHVTVMWAGQAMGSQTQARSLTVQEGCRRAYGTGTFCFL